MTAGELLAELAAHILEHGPDGVIHVRSDHGHMEEAKDFLHIPAGNFGLTGSNLAHVWIETNDTTRKAQKLIEEDLIFNPPFQAKRLAPPPPPSPATPGKHP